MQAGPRLSLGVPVYNGARFLPALFENLSQQTFADFEIVISDNASTDHTADICREWMRRDARIRYHRNANNIGSAGNFNRVFELSTAPLFKWAACDDRYDPDYLNVCVGLLESNPDAVLAQTDVICIDDRGTPFERDAANGTFIIPGTAHRYLPDPVGIAEGAAPVGRFRDVLFQCRSNAQIFGVVRRGALAQTGLLRSYVGSEKATVLELALLGRFLQDRRPLFHRCYYPGVSASMSKAERKRYVSSTARAYWRPWRMLRSFLATPLGKPIRLVETLACYRLLMVQSLAFSGRSLFRSEAVSWPFRAAWSGKSGATGVASQQNNSKT